jgi:23S rRNA G2445 N2-methylase RlmL
VTLLANDWKKQARGLALVVLEKEVTVESFELDHTIVKATVMIDTTGASLFKRGYRVEKGGAPIKENMANLVMYPHLTHLPK